MARIVTPTSSVSPPEPKWKTAGEEVVTIALDVNEVEAVMCKVRDLHRRAELNKDTHPTSLNGAGARVYEALKSAGFSF